MGTNKIFSLLALLLLLSSCFGSKMASSSGGEVTGKGDTCETWSPEDGYGETGYTLGKENASA